MQTHFLRMFSFLLAVLATLSSRLGLVLIRLFLAVVRRFG